MTPTELRTWLLSQPRPSSLRIVAGDQREHKLALGDGIKWKEAAESAMALQPELIEALDDKGGLLRAIRPDDFETEDEHAPADVIDVPAGVDAESQRTIIFARLISEAYRHSTEVAFERLASLFDAVVRRSESQEKTISTLDRMLQKLVLEKVAAGAGGDGEDGAPLTLESLIGSFMQGKMQGAAEKAVNGVTHKESTK